MTKFTAGKFTLDLSSPAPMWVTIRASECCDGELGGFSHKDLVDLRHVIDRAIAEAERRCPGETQ